MFSKIKREQDDANSAESASVVREEVFVKQEYELDSEDEVGNPIKSEDATTEAPSASSDTNIAAQFTCEECGKSFSTKRYLTRHKIRERQKYNGSIYECEFCGKKFSTQHYLSRHKVDIHLREWQICADCDYRSRNKKLYIFHRRNTHGEPDDEIDGLYQCKMCPETFRQTKPLYDHMTGHSIHTCEICLKQFGTRPKLRQHVESHKQYKTVKFSKLQECRSCDFKTLYHNQLKMHKCDDRKFVCHLCDHFWTSDHSVLGSHIINEHANAKTFKCETCGDSYETQQTLDQHERQFHEATPFQCEHCLQYFKVKYGLQKHERKCTLGAARIRKELRKCHLCDYKNLKNPLLLHHIKSFHADAKDFQCEHCGGKFTTELCVTKHVQLYHIPTDHQCRHCSQFFTLKKSLMNHYERCDKVSPKREESQDEDDEDMPDYIECTTILQT